MHLVEIAQFGTDHFELIHEDGSAFVPVLVVKGERINATTIDKRNEEEYLSYIFSE